MQWTTPTTTTQALNINSETAVTLNNQLSIVVEDGTFSQATDLAIVPKPNQSQDEFLRFQLEAMQSGNVVTGEFAKPVRIALDMSSWGKDIAGGNGRFYLAYRDETQPNRWIDVPVTVHQSDGLISAEVTHFSDWAAGWRPEAWTPHWEPPTPSLFTGSATYSYPFQLPAGRGGLQPSLGLSYSSGALTGATTNAGRGMVGTGWSLGGDISIVRTGIEPNGTNMLYPNEFRLTLNGTGYELIQDATDSSRWHVKDAPSIYAKNYGGYQSTDTTGSYWIVKTGDGTQYRLGYTTDAVSTQRYHFIGAPSSSPQVIGWKVDTITDRDGNQLQYSYQNTVGTAYAEYGALSASSYEAVLDYIYYNFPNQATSITPTVARFDPQTIIPLSGVSFAYTYAVQDNPATPTIDERQYPQLYRVDVFHKPDPNNSFMGMPIHRYDIVTTVYTEENTGCQTELGNPDATRMSHTRIIDHIQEFGFAPNGSIEEQLPPITFHYTPYVHYQHDGSQGGSQFNGDCFIFNYLSNVDNGYGGSYSIDYNNQYNNTAEEVIPAHGTYNIVNGTATYPGRVMSYHVRQTIAEDGQGNQMVTAYNYDTPCYNQQSSNNANGIDATTCPQGEWEDVPLTGPLGGFKIASATILDSQNNSVSRSRSEFIQNDPYLFGRILQTKSGVAGTGDFDLTVASQNDNSYFVEVYANAGNPTDDDVIFSYTDRATQTVFENGLSHTTITTYTYGLAEQGGTQYGNLTHASTYIGSTNNTPIKTSVTTYQPNSNAWLVSLPATQMVHDGTASDPMTTGSLYFYDGATDWATTPSEGQLTMSRAIVPTACDTIILGCVTAYETIDSQLSYDSFGNPQTTTSYQTHGHIPFDASGNRIVSEDRLGTVPQSTSISYESTFNLYPTSVTDALNNTTSFAIYGFNGVADDGNQPGLLKSVDDPATDQTVTYTYDAFGRLSATYRHTDGTAYNPASPDTLHTYVFGDNSTPTMVATWGKHTSSATPWTSDGTWTRTYYDGFGRLLQTQTPNEAWPSTTGADEGIQFQTYNELGQVDASSVVYERGGTVTVNPNDLAALQTAYVTPDLNQPTNTSTYDALGRVTSVTGIDGNTSYKRYGMITVNGEVLRYESTIDTNFHRKDYRYNALGQLVEVVEFEGTCSWGYWTEINECTSATDIALWSVYATTSYTYDNQGNLTHVTDATGNTDL